jgi:hypothetical protein
MNITDLQIEVAGQKKIITKDWILKIEQAKAYFEDFEIEQLENKDSYRKAYDFSRAIKQGQECIKKVIESLKDEEILRAEKKLLELNKIMAGKNTQTKKAIDTYKLKEKDLIVENGFSNIIEKKDFKPDFEIYKNECIVQFKGKSKFEEMQDIALKIAEDYSNRLEMYQLKFENIFNKLSEYCKEIDFIKDISEINLDAKNIVEKGIDIEDIKTKYLNIAEEQKKAIAARLEEEKQKREKIEIEIKNNTVDQTNLNKTDKIREVSIDDKDMSKQNDKKRWEQICAYLNKYNFETKASILMLNKIKEIIKELKI